MSKKIIYHICALVLMCCMLFSGFFVISGTWSFFQHFSNEATGIVEKIEIGKTDTIYFKDGKSATMILFLGTPLEHLKSGDKLEKKKYSCDYYLNNRKVIDFTWFANHMYITWVLVPMIILLFSIIFLYKKIYNIWIHKDFFYRDRFTDEKTDDSDFQIAFTIVFILDIIFLPFGIYFLLLKLF
jgi:hypothetical protein